MKTQEISKDFIKTAFQSQHFKMLFSGEKTHKPALEFTKEIIPFTTDKGLIMELIKAGLPEIYRGDTLKETSAMVEWCLENGFDSMSGDDGGETSPPLILLNLVERSGSILFHDKYKNARIEICHEGRKSVHALSSTTVKRWLSMTYFKNIGKAISDQAFRQAFQLLEAKALYESEKIETYLRVAESEGEVVIAMCDEDRHVAVIDNEGYRITRDSPVKFMASPFTSPIAFPDKGNGEILSDLQKLLGLESGNFYRVLSFMIGTFNPKGPYFCLFVEGEQGSGKSFLCAALKTILDPSSVTKLRMPDSDQDLMIMAKENHLLVFDNMSGLGGEMSDALCRLATGGGLVKRKLYTDDESQIFNESRPFICNGITGIASRQDLLERSIPLNLPSIAEGQRKTEEEMLQELERIRPFITDFLFKAVSSALKNFPTTKTPTQFRMADAAKWLQAAEPATGLPKGTLLKALEEGQNEVVMETISSNTLAQALYQIAERGPYEGHVGELLVRMKEGLDIVRLDRKFPSNPAHLSHTLKRYSAGLKRAGINVEFGPKQRNGRLIKVWLSDRHIFDA